MAANNMPEAEVTLDEAAVAALVRSQHRELAGLEVTLFANGWDNQLFRLGDDLVVRLPRRAAAAELVHNEQRVLPLLAPRLPLPVPLPHYVGTPDGDYPWHWSITPWFDGERAFDADFDAPTVAAQLDEFLTALHRPAPDDAPRNPHRGVPLDELNPRVRARTEAIAHRIDRANVLATWDRLRAATPFDAPPVWLHGDLHPLNLLVRNRRIAAVLDFGDVAAGDPATDLAVAWFLFEVEDRERLRRRVDPDTWQRARAWALHFGVMFLAFSADNPAMEVIGETTLRRALAS